MNLEHLIVLERKSYRKKLIDGGISKTQEPAEGALVTKAGII